MSRRLRFPAGRCSAAGLAAAIVALASAGTAAAAVAPTVSTEPASSVAATSATLNGTVNPNGTATSWHFEYGTTTAYGQQTPTQSAGAGTSATGVSALLSGLQTGKLYHFRIVATSTGGTSSGADETFTTVGGAARPGVTTSPATGVTNNAAKLNGTVNPNGQTTTWFFEYGTTTSYGTKTAAKNAGTGTKPVNVSVAIGKLSAGTTYHVRLVASNASGTTEGGDQSFTTSGPPAVQTGTAQAVAATTATLTGTVNPLGQATTWHFEYGTTTAYGFKTPDKKAGGGSAPVGASAPIASLTPGTTYHYRLVATSKAGTTSGTDATFTTVAPVTLKASRRTVVFGSALTLSGTVAGGHSGVTVTVLAQRFGATAFTAAATVLSGSGGTWSYAVRPRIQTSYEASVNGATSRSVAIGVRPHISLTLTSHGARLSTKVSAARSFAGRLVRLQRLSSGRWRDLARKHLNRSSATTFSTGLLPHGTSTVRIAFSVNQAGVGYLGGFSRTRVVHR